MSKIYKSALADKTHDNTLPIEFDPAMKMVRTQRGFGIIEFNDLYDNKCTIQESSLAEPPAIWLGITDVEPKMLASIATAYGIKTERTTGYIDYPIPEEVLINSRMHLSQEQCKALIPHLIKFVETGEI